MGDEWDFGAELSCYVLFSGGWYSGGVFDVFGEKGEEKGGGRRRRMK
jgi:hypothetical protein